jgi:hypothetical protein
MIRPFDLAPAFPCLQEVFDELSPFTGSNGADEQPVELVADSLKYTGWLTGDGKVK